jgi:FtsP/CotA-like multicopper oxidase with cupredoxin domain
VLLHDFSFTPAEELLNRLTGGSGHHAMDHSAMGQMEMGEMPMGNMSMGHMAMGNMPMAGMDLNDIDYDAYLANDRTLDDPDVIQVDKGGRVRLRIINGAASTAFSIDAGSLAATLVAVDGKPVMPLAGRYFSATMGQRLDIVVTIPQEGGAFPILALREGVPERTGIILASQGAVVEKIAPRAETEGPVLDLTMEQALRASHPLASRHPDRQFMVHLAGDMASYRWAMMGASDLAARTGERIEVAMMNMSMMAHPMHLHGHEFQVVAIDGEPFSGAVRDTVLVPPMRTLTIAFDGGAPGKWPFHCHHLYHMASGMMVHMPVTA